jgi:RNA polymerase sigma-70 factor (ECF subfamily)
MSRSEEARRAAELAARQSYGRLLAYLAARTRDVAAAEDALADAFHAALRTWPERGVPDVPDAWLLTAARRSLVSQHRREQVRVQAEPVVAHLQALADVDSGERFPDERLGLLFICAHPAIDPTVRAPLMLQVVLGLDAARLASAFLVAPATMSQRLVRAKTKIAAAGIPFGVPEPRELPGRVADVLDAIYAAFGIAWSEVVHGTERWVDLAEEALWLARVVVDLLPDSAEARGLLALLVHSHARRAARRDAVGRFVPLSEQDVTRWDCTAMDEADRHLEAAAALRQPGPYQIEATIQAAHGFRRHGRVVPWLVIAQLHDALAALAPAVGVLVSRAAAIGEARGADDALAALSALDESAIRSYQPYWALRAHLLAQLGQTQPAREAYDRAAGLATDPGVRAFLLARAATLG